MTVIDVNTGKFTGQGGNLEETVTRNNLEAAEEIVRQLRLRDVGGIVVIDFIDMVLESNRELVLRRLLECLARDRTKHQVAEVTSLGLVQMTRKRVGAGLLEAFSQQCECCNGRGVILTLEVPAETAHRSSAGSRRARPGPDAAARQAQATATATATAGAAGTAPDPRPANGRSGNRRSGGRLRQRLARPRRRRRGHVPGRHRRDDAALARRPRSTTLPWTAGRTATPSRSWTPPRPTAPPPWTTPPATAAPSRARARRESARNGGRRTRRPTNGGTAFAAAVNVEDTAGPGRGGPRRDRRLPSPRPTPAPSSRSPPPATPPRPRTPRPRSGAPAPAPAPPSPG